MQRNPDSLWWRLVRFGFRLLYNEMAFTYDTVSAVVSLGAWRCWQQAAMRYLPHADAGYVLEIAHGTGNLQLDLHRAGYDSFGYDLSPYMGRIAAAKMRRHQAEPRLTRGMAQQLPFADATFSAVISTFPTDFIVKAATLHDIHRVLQTGGVCVVVLNGVLVSGGVLKDVLEWLYRITGQREGTSTDSVIHADDARRVEAYFEGYGFDVALHEVPCPRSVAHVVVLTKQAS